MSNLYDGVAEAEVLKSTIFSARALIESDPAYAYATARLLLHQIRAEVVGQTISFADMKEFYPTHFADYIRIGIEAGRIDPRLSEFDLPAIGAAIHAERDLKFQYLGLQTLYDRYLLHINGRRIRIAAGILDAHCHGPGIERSGARDDERSSFTSCFPASTSSPPRRLCSTPEHCDRNSPRVFSPPFPTISPVFMMRSKKMPCSRSTAVDWATIGLRCVLWALTFSGTNGKSQGVVPFLKVVNDTAVAVNQGGKRQGRGLQLSRNLAPRHRGIS